MIVPINSTWLISSVPTPCTVLIGLARSVAAEIHALEEILHHGAHLAELATRSCKALAASGSGSSGGISLMSCWVCKYIFLLWSPSAAFVVGGYQLSQLKRVQDCQPHPQQVARSAQP
jgi:hypothetical protein